MRVPAEPRRRRFTSTSLAILAAAAGLGMSACGDPAEAMDPAGPDAPAGERTVAGCTQAGPLVAAEMAAIAAPAGSELYLRLRAEGAQIYTCGSDGSGGWKWSLKAPDARLIDDRCVEVGTHFAGPSWKIGRDGSTVVARKAAEAPAPSSGSVPWLLLEAVDTTGAGMLGGVSYIQRSDTVGGVAPYGGCDAAAAGAEQPVPYTATYLFYRQAASGPDPKY